MAIDSTVVLEVRLTGSDTNSGGFVPGSGGTDWSQQNSPQYNVTDGVTNGSATVTSATANFGTDVVGNLIYIMGGTGVGGSGGWYQIVSRTNNTTIVVDRSTALTAGTGTTLTIGGAIATPGLASAILAFAGGGTAFIKYNVSPYVITTASYNVQGGCCQPPDACKIIGYDTTRSIYTPFQNRPTIQLGSGVSSASMFQALNNAYFLQGVILDANLQTTSTCWNSSGECFYVKAMNFTNNGLRQNVGSGVLILCEITGASSALTCTLVQAAYWCVAHDNTQAGGNQAGITAVYTFECVAYNNTQDGIAVPPGGSVAINCVSYNNGARGFYFGNTADEPVIAINCIAEANGSYGFYTNTGHGQLINCGDFNNTSGRKNSPTTMWNADIGTVTGSGSFFVAAGSGNFALNSTVGAGVSARAAAFPSQFPLALTARFADVGAAQHQDSGGASGPVGQLHIFNRGAPY